MQPNRAGSRRERVSNTHSGTRSGYYEGILQLRNTRNRHFTDAAELIERILNSKSGIQLARAVDMKDGTDFYLTSKKVLNQLARTLHARFGAKIVVSPRLFSQDRQSSKKVYRITVAARLPQYSPGDVVRSKDSIVYVMSFRNGAGHGIDLMRSRYVRIRDDALILVRADDISTTSVSKSKPELEVLHPQSYQSTPVANQQPVAINTVRVAEIDGKLYLIPPEKS